MEVERGMGRAGNGCGKEGCQSVRSGDKRFKSIT